MLGLNSFLSLVFSQREKTNSRMLYKPSILCEKKKRLHKIMSQKHREGGGEAHNLKSPLLDYSNEEASNSLVRN